MGAARKFGRAVTALSIALLAVPDLRAESAREPGAARALYDEMGVSSELVRLSVEAKAYLAQHAVGIAPAHRRRLAEIIESGFHPEQLEALAFENFVAHYEPGHAQTALRWLAQDTTRDLYLRGRGTRAATRCAPTADAPMRQEHRRLALRVALTNERVRALLRASSVFTELIRAGNAALPESQRVPDERLEPLFRRQRDMLQAMVSGAAREGACAYADVPLSTLREAVTFLDGVAGVWMRSAMDRAVASALRQAAAATVQQIASAFGRDGEEKRPLREARAEIGGAR